MGIGLVVGNSPCVSWGFWAQANRWDELGRVANNYRNNQTRAPKTPSASQTFQIQKPFHTLKDGCETPTNPQPEEVPLPSPKIKMLK